MDKAYIVANEQQERIILENLEREGYGWRGLNAKPTEQPRLIDKPITIFARDDKRLTFDYGVNEAYFADFEIVFDGRKEERLILVDSFENSIDKKELIEILKGFDLIKEKEMSEKYVVSQEFMNELEDWKNNLTKYNEPGYFIDWEVIQDLPTIVIAWWGDEVSNEESNNHLIAILRWVNGEDVFEVEKPKKWVVRSKETDSDGDHWYVDAANNLTYIVFYENDATRFDTKEEAQSWANSHQEVVQVEVEE